MSESRDHDRPSEGVEILPPEADGAMLDERMAEPVAPAAQSSSRGVIGGAVAGAVAALVVGYGLYAAGWLDRSDPTLPARIGALESRLSDLVSSAGGLDQRVTAVEQRPVPTPPDLAPLEQATTRLGAEDAALRDTLAKQASAAEMARQALDQGLRELRETTSGLSLSLAEQRARIDTLAAQRPDLQPLTDGLKAAQATLTDQGARLADLAARVGGLEDTLAGARKAATDSKRLAVALVELDRAFAAGEPLATSLEPFASLAGDPAVGGPLAKLQPLRSDGPPTVADLQAALAAERPRIVEAIRYQGASGWVGQVTQNLAGLVDLHRVDDGKAPASAELDAAAEALARGDVSAAVTAMQPLADAGNAAAADWLAQARQRLEGLEAVDGLRAYLTAHMPASP